MQASYYANRNNRNYKPYSGMEPVYPDHLASRKHAVVGHFAEHKSQRCVIAKEEVVQLRRAEGRSLSPPARKEVFVGRAAGDKSLIGTTARFQPPPIYDQPMGPAWINFRKENSPPSRNYYYDSNSDYGKSSDDESDDDDDDDDGEHDCDNHGPIKPGRLYGRDEKPDEIYKKDKNKPIGYPPHAYTIPNRDQTPYKEGDNRPNRNYGYAPPDEIYKKENKKTIGYAPLAYTIPNRDQTSNNEGDNRFNRNYEYVPPNEIYKKEKNNTTGYAPYPDTIPNRDQKPQNYVYAPPVFKIIPQIKTRVGDPEFAKKGPDNSQPGHREVIDSTEARKRYGRLSTRGGPHVEEKYTGTIDSMEAARRYKGVFVTD